MSEDEQALWRNNLRFEIRKKEQLKDIDKKIKFFSPPNFYSISNPTHQTEREVMEFDLYNLRNSNIVVVNFNKPESIGTAMELMYAKEHNIPVIALNENNKEIHSWLIECCSGVFFNSMKDLVEYLWDYYLSI